MLAFGIGVLTPAPEIQLLCIANAASIFLDYIYTITLYAAVMCIGGSFEMRKQLAQKKPVQEENLERSLVIAYE